MFSLIKKESSNLVNQESKGKSLKKRLLVVGLLLSATNFDAHAVLTPYNSNGVNLVYSSVSDVTWTQDANLFKTLYDADNTLISQIAAVTPTYNDSSYFGLQTIDAEDFNTLDGRMTWWGANAFVDYLNSINYGGSNQWRLPSAGSNPQFGYNQTGSELGQLFYSELGGTENHSLPNTSAFNNEQISVYWMGTEYAPITTFDRAWVFQTWNGYQNGNGHKNSNYHAWAVSPGLVPIPGAVWLFGTGLLGLLDWKRRRHVG